MGRQIRKRSVRTGLDRIIGVDLDAVVIRKGASPPRQTGGSPTVSRVALTERGGNACAVTGRGVSSQPSRKFTLTLLATFVESDARHAEFSDAHVRFPRYLNIRIRDGIPPSQDDSRTDDHFSRSRPRVPRTRRKNRIWPNLVSRKPSPTESIDGIRIGKTEDDPWKETATPFGVRSGIAIEDWPYAPSTTYRHHLRRYRRHSHSNDVRRLAIDLR